MRLPYVGAIWDLVRETVLSFLADDALSRGAAIAFYTATSLASVLLIVIAIAGFVLGHGAAEREITAELNGLMGDQAAEVLQTAIANASNKSSSILATIIGIGTLIVTASGVFGEMQSALNIIRRGIYESVRSSFGEHPNTDSAAEPIDRWSRWVSRRGGGLRCSIQRHIERRAVLVLAFAFSIHTIA